MERDKRKAIKADAKAGVLWRELLHKYRLSPTVLKGVIGSTRKGPKRAPKRPATNGSTWMVSSSDGIKAFASEREALIEVTRLYAAKANAVHLWNAVPFQLQAVKAG